MSTPTTTDGSDPTASRPAPADGTSWNAWAQPAPTPGRQTTPGAPEAAHPQGRGAQPAEPAQPGATESGWPSPPPSTTPPWARWALGALLAATAALYLWGLSRNGWANSYYSAAAQAGGESWAAWFFGGLDSANSITVDKPPASLWLMGLSTRIFGLSSWSVLVPQALLGVASVGVLYATVRRWFGAPAGLIAGAVLALTPVATLMFRFNNPDAMLVFLLVCAAWAMGRATEKGSMRWIMVAGAFVGFAFLAKMMQAFLVLPGFVAMYLVAAPLDLRRRIGHLFAALGAMVVAGGWWVAIVELWPAGSRPYIGGSQTNSILELILGYNGFGRLTGDEPGSVVPGGATGQGGQWGETGWDRLLSSSYGGQVAWLLPAALVMIVVLLWVSRRGPRTDLTRAAVLGWGGWLLVTAAVISYSQGIIHEYYTVALAPAIGALVGIGALALWSHRAQLWARLTSAGLFVGSVLWSSALLARSEGFVPWLAPLVVTCGSLAAAGALVAPRVRGVAGRRVALGASTAGLVAVLAGPTAYALETASTSASGSLPSAGPTVAGARSGPGAGGPGRDGQGAPGLGQLPGAPGTGPGAQGGVGQGGPNLGGPGQGGPGLGQLPGAPGTGQLPGAPGTGQLPGATGRPNQGGGGTGSLLEGSTPSDQLTQALLGDADSFTWVAATVGANSAAGYQLATQEPVMAIGGFNGSDPAPTLQEFQAHVADGQIHYFIPAGLGGGRGGNGGGRQNGGSQEASLISAWVESRFTPSTIGGTTVYDLTDPLAGGATPSPAATSTTSV